MIPRETTLHVIEHELTAARLWAERHVVPLTWLPSATEIRAVLTQPETEELFYLRCILDDYRRLPPAWTFTDETWEAEPAMHLFPLVSATQFGAPLFIRGKNGPIICAPFNRLAYAEHKGPHGDWRGPTNWLTAGQANQVKAHYLGDMLQIIHRDFTHSRARMS